jgi:hypothetical protein
MSTIKFHSSQKRRVDEARIRWQRLLPRGPGQIGLTQIVWVEHPPIGDEIVVDVDDGFADFLHQEGVPFGVR